MSQYADEIRNMRWSYSRLSTYEQCPYQFYLNYILVDEHHHPLYEQEQNFWAEYGSFCHDLLERYLKGKLTSVDAWCEFEDRYEEVLSDYEWQSSYEKYYQMGDVYFGDLVKPKGEILEVEGKHDFKVGDYKFTGRIDLLLREDEKIIICDHKSAQSVLGKRGTVLKSKQKQLEGYKKQMYLYSKPVLEKYGRVDYLEWNFFNSEQVYRIPFEQKEYEDTLRWATDLIERIADDDTFDAKKEFYFCWNICPFRNNCEYKNEREEGD